MLCPHRIVLPFLSATLVFAAAAAAQRPTMLVAAPAPLDLSCGWGGFGRDPQHNAVAPVYTQDLNRVLWSTPVDLQPQYSGSALLVHYGTPLITPNGTVIVTVKTGVSGTFQLEGRASGTGALQWTLPSDYVLPAHNWTPSVGASLMPQNRVVVPAAGGTVLMRSTPDAPTGLTQRAAFYGLPNYLANPAAYDGNVFIDTPITCDAAGNLYFGFVVTGATPVPLQSGIARISAAGVGTWVSAATAANDPAIAKVTYNCAPAVSADGHDLYISVNQAPGSGFTVGWLLRLNAQTLALQSRVQPLDAMSSNPAAMPDDGTASPLIGPDGDVYFGVFENPFGSNHYRGWLTHYDRTLAQTRIAGDFGWDCTPSILPRSAVPSYAGTSQYLLMSKYNNYGGIGGDGLNKVAVLDPFASQLDPQTGATVMREVLTIVGPTPDPGFPGGVKEWCINSAAVDPLRHSALVNNEDGKMYRWDFVTNTLTQTVTLTAGLGEAYTPTIVGPDGVVYAINNATLFAVGQ
jgi:hypothetical protein